MSQLVLCEFSSVPIAVARYPKKRHSWYIMYYVLFNLPMKITFHIIRRTEHLGINHSTSIDFVLSRISVNCATYYLL